MALFGVDAPPRPDLSARAQRFLEVWLSGRDVLVGASVGADRWGRAPARLFAAKGDGPEAPFISVAAALLEEGLGRFRPDPAAAACAKAYLAAEARARDAARGLWADPALRPIDPAALDARARLSAAKGLTIVEGKIRAIGETRGALYLNFGKNRSEDFSVVISRRDLSIFEASGINLRTLNGRQARVRGLIETGSGPRMQISAPAEIEIVDRASR